MSIDFDGVTEQIDYGTSINPTPNTTEFTAMSWFKVVSDVQGMILSKSDASSSNRQFFIFYQFSSKKIGIRSGGGSALILSTTLVNDGEWHHAVLRNHDNAPFEYELFIDGVSEGFGITGTETSAAPVRIATRGVSPTFDNFWGNPVDDARFYDRALNAAEILEIYNARGGDNIVDGLKLRASIADGAPGTTTTGKDFGPDSLVATVVGTPTNEESILTRGRRRVQVS